MQKIVQQGGRCLIPVFALGRAQELLLILDEFWSQNPDLQEIPIYYASSLAKKCMAVYQTYIFGMNDKIRRQIAVNNPFIFKHISNLKGIDHFDDFGPCVVMASPGMMQSGLSRELFETWCGEPKNGVIIAGYCVEGTLAKTVLSEPEEIVSMSGQKLPLNMSVDYISFSAHTDYQQTSEFIRLLKPTHVVLVHGEQNEMLRLKSALMREYENNPNANITFYNPRNTHAVELYFKGEKTAKVMGSLAAVKGEDGDKVSGILVKRDFKYHVLSSNDLSKYTDMSMSTVTQRQSLAYTGSALGLKYLLERIGGPGTVEVIEMDKKFKAFDVVEVNFDGKIVVLEWQATPVNDMYADTVLASILQTELCGTSIKGTATVKPDRQHFKECVVETLQEMFGDNSVPKLFKGDEFSVSVNDKNVDINLETLEVTCTVDEILRDTIFTAVNKLHQVLVQTK